MTHPKSVQECSCRASKQRDFAGLSGMIEAVFDGSSNVSFTVQFSSVVHGRPQAVIAVHLLQRVTNDVISHLDKAPQAPQLSTPGSPKRVLELLSAVWML